MPDRADRVEEQRGFFPLPLGDLLFLLSLIALAVVAFLPWARDVEWGGVAVSGWLLAALMVLSPAIALLRIARRRRRRRRPPSTTEPPR